MAVLAGGFCLGHATAPGGDLAFKVMRIEPEIVWLRAYVAPAMNFHQLAGPTPDAYVEGCRVVKDVRSHPDHVDKALILECSKGIRLELKNIDFEN